MYCRVYLYQNGSLHSMNDIPPDPAKAKPPHFIAVGGEEIRDFQIDYKNVGASEIRTQFGAGRKLNLTGYAKTSQGVIIEKTLAVELYQDFPDAALVSATYRNTDQDGFHRRDPITQLLLPNGRRTRQRRLSFL